MRRLGFLVVAGFLVLVSARASFAQAGNDAIARLEKARAKRPNDPAVARSLGIAYYKAEKYPEARSNLETA
ncbi:MAG TPA: hypothetical protein VF483_01140, partial [Gemmatimonadaceae bacterium]